MMWMLGYMKVWYMSLRLRLKLQYYTGLYMKLKIEHLVKNILEKKFFWARKTRQVKLKKKKYLGESNWRTYYGSSEKLLLEVNKDKSRFKRTILRLCKSKSECAYFEAKLQFENDVLLKDEYWNDWIMVKVRAAHLKKLKETLDFSDNL